MTAARELERETQGARTPPPPVAKLTEVSDPDKPPCHMCGHTWRDHAVLRCTGRTPSVSLDRDSHCVCVRYVPPPTQARR